MDLMNELIVSVVGGVVTAVILESFRGGSRDRKAERAAAVEAARSASPAVAAGARGAGVAASIAAGAKRAKAPKRPGRIAAFFAGLVRVVLALCGGLLVATLGFRMAIAADLIERAPLMRLAFFVAGTAVFWVLLLIVRGRR